jgi:hypothetical protein
MSSAPRKLARNRQPHVDFADLCDRPAYVSKLAQRKGGVDVYDVERLAFRLWIPHTRMR